MPASSRPPARRAHLSHPDQNPLRPTAPTAAAVKRTNWLLPRMDLAAARARAEGSGGGAELIQRLRATPGPHGSQLVLMCEPCAAHCAVPCCAVCCRRRALAAPQRCRRRPEPGAVLRQATGWTGGLRECPSLRQHALLIACAHQAAWMLHPCALLRSCPFPLHAAHGIKYRANLKSAHRYRRRG